MDLDSEGKRLTGLYSGMTDEELEELVGDLTSLTEEARLALSDEIARRGLSFISGDALPTEKDIELDELVTIRRFRDLMEAIMAKGLLESAGIECFLIDENIVRIDWLISNAIGGIKLQVNRQDADSAVKVLGQPTPSNPEVQG